MAKQSLETMLAAALESQKKAEKQFADEAAGLKSKATRQSEAFEDDLFKSWGIARRVWIVIHKPTNRKFQLKGHPNIHQFWIDEYVMIKGKEVLSPTIVKSNRSKKECLLLLEKYVNLIVKETFKAPPKPIYVRPEVTMPLYAETPVKRMKLQVKAVADDKFVYKDELGRKFMIAKYGRFWNCADVNMKQPIAVQMSSHEEALGELYSYLEENPFKLIPTGVDVAIVVEKRPDNLFQVTTSLKSNNEVLYSSLEDVETLDNVVDMEKVILVKQGYKWEIRLRDQVKLRGVRKEARSPEAGQGEIVIKQEE